MKTLDEVIAELEDEGLFADALHYLRGIETTENLYHDAVNELSKWIDEDWKDRCLPLTWDELKTMEGKPVWVEADDGKYKGWVIVGKFYSLLEKEDLDAHVDLYYFGRSMEYSKEMYGYYWQAYRKERL